MTRAEQVLDFWFGALDVRGRARPDKARRWFHASPQFDREIVARFGPCIAAALGGGLEAWSATPTGSLALIVVLDQFTRNAFRGRARAFAGDVRAQALSRRMIERGDDRALAFDHRLFAYLPLEHAESRLCQATHIGLLEQMRDELPPARRAELDNAFHHARQHAGIIARFGRFPHRNAILGRPSTTGECAYLKSGAGRFGQ